MAAPMTLYYRNHSATDSTTASRDDARYVTPETIGWTAPTGKRFVEWNLQRDGSGATRAVGDTALGDFAVYAIWENVATYGDLIDLDRLSEFKSGADSAYAAGNSAHAAARAAGIPFGNCDPTSTGTAFTATVEGLDTLYDGACVMLHNGVETSASGFTINVNNLGDKPVYSNLATGNDITPTNPTRDTTIFNINYTLLFVYDSQLVEGGAWICYRGYDSNTNTIGYQLRTNSGNRPMSDAAYRYRLYFTSADGSKWVPANTSTSTDATTSRTLNTRAIDPFGPIVYNSTNGTTNSGARPAVTTLWQQYTLTIGYSYVKSLTAWDSVWLKCQPNADGSAVMKDIVQALPSSKDGYIYILLGMAYSTTAMELRSEHPVYWHDGTGIRIWTGAEPSGGIEAITLNTSAEPYSVPVSAHGEAVINIGSGLSVDEGNGWVELSADIPNPATAAPLADGTAAVGSSAKYAREDHVHPTDTSRQATLVSGTNIKTINGTSLLGSGDLTVGGSVSMEEEDVDAAVEAAWPAPIGYAITPRQTDIQYGNLKGIGLSDEVSSGEFVSTAAEGETVYVLLNTGHWEPEVTIDSSGSAVSYNQYGPGVGGMLFTFTMPADAVTVGAWYND